MPCKHHYGIKNTSAESIFIFQFDETLLINARIKYWLNLCIHWVDYIVEYIHLFLSPESVIKNISLVLTQSQNEEFKKNACPNSSTLLWTCPERMRLGISITRWQAGERSGVIISRDWRWPLVVPVITSQRVVLAFPLLFPHCTAGSEFQSAPDLQSPRF